MVTRKEVLYEIFVDTHKAYGALERWQTLEILEGYGVAPQVCRLLTRYWDYATMETRARG